MANRKMKQLRLRQTVLLCFYSLYFHTANGAVCHICPNIIYTSVLLGQSWHVHPVINGSAFYFILSLQDCQNGTGSRVTIMMGRGFDCICLDFFWPARMEHKLFLVGNYYIITPRGSLTSAKQLPNENTLLVLVKSRRLCSVGRGMPRNLVPSFSLVWRCTLFKWPKLPGQHHAVTSAHFGR